MAKYCTQCWFRAAGIPCEQATDLCVALDAAGSNEGAFLLRIRLSSDSDADQQLERLRAALLEAADLMIDSVLGEEPALQPAEDDTHTSS
jgi:hypothetical protein